MLVEAVSDAETQLPISIFRNCHVSKETLPAAYNVKWQLDLIHNLKHLQKEKGKEGRNEKGLAGKRRP